MSICASLDRRRLSPAEPLELALCQRRSPSSNSTLDSRFHAIDARSWTSIASGTPGARIRSSALTALLAARHLAI